MRTLPSSMYFRPSRAVWHSGVSVEAVAFFFSLPAAVTFFLGTVKLGFLAGTGRPISNGGMTGAGVAIGG